MQRHINNLPTTEIAIIDWLYNRATLGNTSDHLAFIWALYRRDHGADEFDPAGQEVKELFERFSHEYAGHPDILLQPDIAIRACAGIRWLVTTIVTECLLGMDGLVLAEGILSRMEGMDLYHKMSWTLRNSLHESLIGGRYADQIYTGPGPLDADGTAISKDDIWYLVEDLLYYGVPGITEWLSDFHVRAVYQLSFGLVCRGYDVTPDAPDAQVITGRLEYLLALAD